ncbi:MAG: transglutaminase domain-containing protein [Lachnospiraceae bacterium]|nr:transglutaminase domain-containing protein [Lachnospiraceae bacterium]
MMELKGMLIGIGIGVTVLLALQNINNKEIIEKSTLQVDSQKMSSAENRKMDELIEVIVDDMDYAYSKLSDTEKTIYLEMLSTIQNYNVEKKLSTQEPEKLDKVFNCVMIDHPEIYYIDGYKYTKYTVEDEIQAIEFKPNYIMEREEIGRYSKKIDTYTKNCIAGMPVGDEYIKAKYIYDYIIKNTEYDSMASHNQNICSVFVGKRSVCQGYAKAIQYVMNKAGIWCTVVTGTANKEAHMWNIVKINGRYYHLDATWGDSSYKNSGNTNLQTSVTNYDYFLVPTYSILYTHRVNNMVAIPECNNTDDNYYEREGFLLTEYDEEKIMRAFDVAYINNSHYVSIKCNNQIIYNEIKRKLVEEQEIFMYLQEGRSVRYNENKELLILGFYY